MPSAMGDEPSPRELDWRMNDMREEMRSGFANLNTRLDRVPTSELLMAHLAGWQLQLDSMKEDIAEAKADRNRDAQRRLLLITGILVPFALSLFALATSLGVIG